MMKRRSSLPESREKPNTPLSPDAPQSRAPIAPSAGLSARQLIRLLGFAMASLLVMVATGWPRLVFFLVTISVGLAIFAVGLRRRSKAHSVTGVLTLLLSVGGLIGVWLVGLLIIERELSRSVAIALLAVLCGALVVAFAVVWVGTHEDHRFAREVSVLMGVALAAAFAGVVLNRLAADLITLPPVERFDETDADIDVFVTPQLDAGLLLVAGYYASPDPSESFGQAPDRVTYQLFVEETAPSFEYIVILHGDRATLEYWESAHVELVVDDAIYGDFGDPDPVQIFRGQHVAGGPHSGSYVGVDGCARTGGSSRALELLVGADAIARLRPLMLLEGTPQNPPLRAGRSFWYGGTIPSVGVPPNTLLPNLVGSIPAARTYDDYEVPAGLAACVMVDTTDDLVLERSTGGFQIDEASAMSTADPAFTSASAFSVPRPQIMFRRRGWEARAQQASLAAGVLLATAAAAGLEVIQIGLRRERGVS